MRILLLYDKLIMARRSEVDTALERIKVDYAESTPVTWSYEDRDFSNLRWVEYQPNYLGIAWDIVYKDTGLIPKDKYDQIIYLVSEENWVPQIIGGWSLGTPINGFTVQIVRIYRNNPEWLYKTFAMEIAHSWNDLCIQELGDNLLSSFGVNDFDNAVIHGEDQRYGVSQGNEKYFTNYDYTPTIAIIKDKLKMAYSLRKARHENIGFQFTKNLYWGLRNKDVLELQKRFVKEGLASYTPTGYFGKLTLLSARAYQIKHSIKPAWGFVGPITRGVLNRTVSASPQFFHFHN